MRRVKKEFKKVIIKVVGVDMSESGELKQEKLQDIEIFVDTINEKNIKKLAQERYGDSFDTLLTSYKTEAETYVMSAEDFIKYGTLITK